jgi:hypothetical protein
MTEIVFADAMHTPIDPLKGALSSAPEGGAMGHQIMRRKSARRVGGPMLAIIIALSVAGHRADAAMTSGTETVRSFYDTLLATMKNSAGLGMRGRSAVLETPTHRS